MYEEEQNSRDDLTKQSRILEPTIILKKKLRNLNLQRMHHSTCHFLVTLTNPLYCFHQTNSNDLVHLTGNQSPYKTNHILKTAVLNFLFSYPQPLPTSNRDNKTGIRKVEGRLSETPSHRRVAFLAKRERKWNLRGFRRPCRR